MSVVLDRNIQKVSSNHTICHIQCIHLVDSIWHYIVLHYMGYIGMCGPKGLGFSAVLVISKVSILPILVINRISIFVYSY